VRPSAAMPTSTAPDGTRLAYHLQGDGPPLICPPGGPMRDSAYFGDLGGLPERFQTVMLDLRGTGQSAAAADPQSCRCDRLVQDVEAGRRGLVRRLSDRLPDRNRVKLSGHGRRSPAQWHAQAGMAVAQGGTCG
jgi:pimeloyl-ACP methyl ester carboxylesterase